MVQSRPVASKPSLNHVLITEHHDPHALYAGDAQLWLVLPSSLSQPSLWPRSVITLDTWLPLPVPTSLLKPHFKLLFSF